MSKYEKSSLCTKVLDAEHEYSKTHINLKAADLLEIIAKVMAESNAFEQLDECDFFDATQIH